MSKQWRFGSSDGEIPFPFKTQLEQINTDPSRSFYLKDKNYRFIDPLRGELRSVVKQCNHDEYEFPLKKINK